MPWKEPTLFHIRQVREILAACRAAGIPIVGCAPRARDELRLGARIDARFTVDKLLLELRRGPLAPGSVVVLDEASMAGTRKLSLWWSEVASGYAYWDLFLLRPPPPRSRRPAGSGRSHRPGGDGGSGADTAAERGDLGAHRLRRMPDAPR